eukprot:c12821_g1_i2.p1 GENE.c12821_g1_i2~~c12821_g1_i2.p1  ORF type:complete len:141 (+),score=22.82 c12821_g1_i2:468-890(+)
MYEKLKFTKVAGCVSWDDVEHWIWRLFLDDVGEFREALGLGAVPELAKSIPLLYGVSPHIITRPPFWSPEVQLCGFWFPHALHNKRDNNHDSTSAHNSDNDCGFLTCHMVKIQNFTHTHVLSTHTHTNTYIHDTHSCAHT